MQVNDQDPEVTEVLAAWFLKRDQLFDARQNPDPTPRETEAIFDLLEEAVEIADELTAFFAPDEPTKRRLIELGVVPV